MKRKITLRLLLLALLVCAFTNAQDRSCAMTEYMEEMLKDPVLKAEYEANQRKFKAELAKRLSGDYQKAGGSEIIIPVAVHFPTANEADRACLVALAQNQIDILNEDYSATNSEISQWNSDMSFYPGTSLGAANIVFCLATNNHPVGVDPELIEGEPAVTIGYNFANGSGFPEFDANWAGYMNFLVKPIGGILGYSPLGGNVAAGGAVVLGLPYFGSGPGCPGSGIVPSAPYNLGRTTTHELGHFYNLGHTFNADGGGVCGGPGGDGIADTPEVANSNYGCTVPGSVDGCAPGSKALTMNFMDYNDDPCMYMFSAGQATVMDTYVSTILQSQFKPNVCPQLSVAEFENGEFSIFPNPNKGEFTLEFSTASNEDININVYDIRGRKIHKSVYSDVSDFNRTISLNNAQSGLYLVMVEIGNKKVTKKIIVE